MQVSHVCRCVSMKPGMTMSPVASMTRASSAARSVPMRGDRVALDEHVRVRHLAELGVLRQDDAAANEDSVSQGRRLFLPVGLGVGGYATCSR